MSGVEKRFDAERELLMSIKKIVDYNKNHDKPKSSSGVAPLDASSLFGKIKIRSTQCDAGTLINDERKYLKKKNELILKLKLNWI